MWRPRMLGGRTNHWGRVALRFGPYDFKPRSRDGLGFDWPITYDELEPWYDEVERLVGVTGGNEGYENCPNSPAGVLLPPPPSRVHEIFLSRAFTKLNINTAAMHAAILTKPLNACIQPNARAVAPFEQTFKARLYFCPRRRPRGSLQLVATR